MDSALLIKIAIGVGGLLVITQFLIQEGKGNIKVPWQVNAYIRILTLLVFVYMLNMGVVLFIPETDASKLKTFTDGVSLSGDAVKTLLGAIIGAVSVSIASDKKLSGLQKDEESNSPSPTEPTA